MNSLVFGPGNACQIFGVPIVNEPTSSDDGKVLAYQHTPRAFVYSASTAAAAGTLTGTTLAANVVTSSLTTVGTIATGVWHGTAVGLAYGGTNADLSATGGTSRVLKQTASGAAITVAQLAAADLSDYASGTWTPSDTSGAGLSFSSVSATYVRIGKLVMVGGTLTYPATGSGASTKVGGLPVASNTTKFISVAVSSGGSIYTATVASGTEFQFINSAGTVLTNAALTGAVVSFTFTYSN